MSVEREFCKENGEPHGQPDHEVDAVGRFAPHDLPPFSTGPHDPRAARICAWGPPLRRGSAASYYAREDAAVCQSMSFFAM